MLSGWENLLFAKVVGDRGLAINPSRASSKPSSPPPWAGHLIQSISSPCFTQTHPCLLLPHPWSQPHEAWLWLEGGRCRIDGFSREITQNSLSEPWVLAVGPSACLRQAIQYRHLHPSASWCYPRHVWQGWGNPPLSPHQCRVPLGPCF